MLFVLFFELFCIFLYNFLYVIQFVPRKTTVFGQFNFWLQPKLGLIAVSHNMNMHPFFLIGKNLEDITAFSAKDRTHIDEFSANIDIIRKYSCK